MIKQNQFPGTGTVCFMKIQNSFLIFELTSPALIYPKQPDPKAIDARGLGKSLFESWNPNIWGT